MCGSFCVPCSVMSSNPAVKRSECECMIQPLFSIQHDIKFNVINCVLFVSCFKDEHNMK